jgi:hypothetical protein
VTGPMQPIDARISDRYSRPAPLENRLFFEAESQFPFTAGSCLPYTATE